MFSLQRLPGSMPDEKIIQVVRRDYFIVFQKICLFVFLAIMPLVFYVLLVGNDATWFESPLYNVLAVLGAASYYLYIWTFFFFTFIDYYLDFWVITNRRIINVEQHGLFSREVTDQHLDKIQDITSYIKGIFPTIFDYGEVEVQSAGANARFCFHQVPRPEKIRELINQLVSVNQAQEKK